MKPLTIINTAIRQDIEGRYCLNDLHHAAMARGKATASNRPANFMRLDQTKRLIAAAIARCSDVSIAPCECGEGRQSSRARHLCDQAAGDAYVMWIDADFNLGVVEAFDTLQTSSIWRRNHSRRQDMNPALVPVLNFKTSSPSMLGC